MKESRTNRLRRAARVFAQQLVFEAKQYGIYEDFGRDEVRKLNEIMSYLVDDWCSYDEIQEMRRIVDSFAEWASTYTGRENW